MDGGRFGTVDGRSFLLHQGVAVFAGVGNGRPQALEPGVERGLAGELGLNLAGSLRGVVDPLGNRCSFGATARSSSIWLASLAASSWSWRRLSDIGYFLLWMVETSYYYFPESVFVEALSVAFALS